MYGVLKALGIAIVFGLLIMLAAIALAKHEDRREDAAKKRDADEADE